MLFQVTVELASDSKDFSSVMARTKLAEMQGKAKIVPITHSTLTDPPPPPPSPPSPHKSESQKYPMGLEAARKYKKMLAQSKSMIYPSFIVSFIHELTICYLY